MIPLNWSTVLQEKADSLSLSCAGLIMWEWPNFDWDEPPKYTPRVFSNVFSKETGMADLHWNYYILNMCQPNGDEF